MRIESQTSNLIVVFSSSASFPTAQEGANAASSSVSSLLHPQEDLHEPQQSAIFSFPRSAAPASRQAPSKPPPRKKNKADTSTSPEAAQIDYLTTELNFTHTKIVGQDNTIRDLEHKVKILEEKLRISEEKLNSDLLQK